MTSTTATHAMFSERLNRQTANPFATALRVLLLIVIAAQLFALTQVVRGQVERAQVRESMRAASNMAIRNCIASSRGKSADDCVAAITVASGP